jgi:integrase
MSDRRRHRGANEGCITKRRDGRWTAIISLGWEGGKRKRRTIYGVTRAQVAAELNKALRDASLGLPVAP